MSAIAFGRKEAISGQRIERDPVPKAHDLKAQIVQSVNKELNANEEAASYMPERTAAALDGFFESVASKAADELGQILADFSRRDFAFCYVDSRKQSRVEVARMFNGARTAVEQLVRESVAYQRLEQGLGSRGYHVNVTTYSRGDQTYVTVFIGWERDRTESADTTTSAGFRNVPAASELLRAQENSLKKQEISRETSFAMTRNAAGEQLNLGDPAEREQLLEAGAAFLRKITASLGEALKTARLNSEKEFRVAGSVESSAYSSYEYISLKPYLPVMELTVGTYPAPIMRDLMKKPEFANLTAVLRKAGYSKPHLEWHPSHSKNDAYVLELNFDFS